MFPMDRRTFLTTLPALAAEGVMAAGPARLGVDLFSLRSQNWDALQLLDYAAKSGAKVVHFSEIRFLGSLEDNHVREVAGHARRLGIDLEIGMRSICPTSTMFDAKQGTAEEQLLRVARAASLAGSRLVRAVLGSMTDRKSDGGIEARIADTVKVLRNVRTRVMDLGLKVAIENHAGDMQSQELKTLIEQAGQDFTGACFDSGNPVWVLEDPHVTLETLAPYVLTSHIRDSYLWQTDEGAAVRWVRMGEGNIGIESLLRRFLELCPGKAMSLEVIVTPPRIFAWRQPDFWKGYERIPAWSFARFAALAAAGTPQPPPPPVPKEEAAARERQDFDVSMAWMRRFLDV
jgi:sugar phosphate isomerase/epimerase